MKSGTGSDWRVRDSFPGNPTLDFQTLDLVVVETEKLHIPVPFRAVPSPRITWHKDGKELKADDRLSFRSVFSLLNSSFKTSVWVICSR